GEKVQQLQRKYKEGSQVPDNIISKKLPDILIQIRQLNNDRDEVIKFARKLKGIDINILSSEYPYEQEDNITTNKIIMILIERYTSIVGRRFWTHYQHFPYDEKIVDMLSYVFANEDENFLALKPSIRKNYNGMFNTNNTKKIINQISNEIGNTKEKISDSFKEWKVEDNSRLSYELWLQILETFLKKQWFITLQNPSIIKEKLNNIDLERYKGILTTYLEAVDYQTYNDELIAQVIDRLKDPREDLQRWIDIPESVIEKVKSYLLEKRLFLFFSEDNDSERFNYWKKYIRYMDEIDIVKEPPIAAMYFPDYVVVEFANIGNAAYFYEKEGF